MAEPLDALVASIHTLSAGTPAEHATLCTQLKAAEESLARAAAGGGAPLAEALATLDPTSHTLGCIYFLCVRWQSAACATPLSAR